MTLVINLLEQGVLDLSTTARSVLGDDLPLIDDRVTVEHRARCRRTLL
jgi:hypothetical protein